MPVIRRLASVVALLLSIVSISLAAQKNETLKVTPPSAQTIYAPIAGLTTSRVGSLRS